MFGDPFAHLSPEQVAELIATTAGDPPPDMSGLPIRGIRDVGAVPQQSPSLPPQDFLKMGNLISKAPDAFAGSPILARKTDVSSLPMPEVNAPPVSDAQAAALADAAEKRAEAWALKQRNPNVIPDLGFIPPRPEMAQGDIDAFRQAARDKLTAQGIYGGGKFVSNVRRMEPERHKAFLEMTGQAPSDPVDPRRDIENNLELALSKVNSGAHVESDRPDLFDSGRGIVGDSLPDAERAALDQAIMDHRASERERVAPRRDARIAQAKEKARLKGARKQAVFQAGLQNQQMGPMMALAGRSPTVAAALMNAMGQNATRALQREQFGLQNQRLSARDRLEAQNAAARLGVAQSEADARIGENRAMNQYRADTLGLKQKTFDREGKLLEEGGHLTPPGANASISKLLKTPEFGGRLDSKEHLYLEGIKSSAPDPARAVIEFGRQKGWSDAEINLALRRYVGGSHRSVDDPGGWSNYWRGYRPDKKTGAMRGFYRDGWKGL